MNILTDLYFAAREAFAHVTGNQTEIERLYALRLLIYQNIFVRRIMNAKSSTDALFIDRPNRKAPYTLKAIPEGVQLALLEWEDACRAHVQTSKALSEAVLRASPGVSHPPHTSESVELFLRDYVDVHALTMDRLQRATFGFAESVLRTILTLPNAAGKAASANLSDNTAFRNHEKYNTIFRYELETIYLDLIEISRHPRRFRRHMEFISGHPSP